MTDRSSAEAAEYIAGLLGELAGIAREAKLDLLAYPLDVAHLEAANLAIRPALLGDQG